MKECINYKSSLFLFKYSYRQKKRDIMFQFVPSFLRNGFCDAKPGNKLKKILCPFFSFFSVGGGEGKTDSILLWERVKRNPFYSKTDFCLCQMFSFFRYYETNRPVMVVSDVEVIKQVLVKKFSKFNIRKV